MLIFFCMSTTFFCVLTTWWFPWQHIGGRSFFGRSHVRGGRVVCGDVRPRVLTSWFELQTATQTLCSLPHYGSEVTDSLSVSFASLIIIVVFYFTVPTPCSTGHRAHLNVLPRPSPALPRDAFGKLVCPFRMVHVFILGHLFRPRLGRLGKFWVAF